jgi:hypothetical protein
MELGDTRARPERAWEASLDGCRARTGTEDMQRQHLHCYPGIVQPRWVDCGGGLSYFDAMTEKHGVERKLDRYICAMDLLGRAGRGWKRCISCYGACRSHQTRLRGLPFCILAWSIRTAPWGAWLRCAGAENSSAWWWRELRETTDAGLWQCWFETVRPREKCKSCSRLQLGHLSF